MLKFKNLLCCTMSVILMLSLMSCSVVEKLNSHYEGDLVIDQTENVSVSETVIKALENNDADAIYNVPLVKTQMKKIIVTAKTLYSHPKNVSKIYAALHTDLAW